jgi:hypothetical protein
MHDLNYQLKGICFANKDGSEATQAARLRSLNLMANQLHDLGFRHLSPNGLKPKHVAALLQLWKSSSISSATIKNRLAHLRWWAIKVRKPGIIPNSNSSLDVTPRVFVTNLSKAVTLSQDSLDLISDPFIKLSLQLQAAFGLRREESIKFIPSWADKGSSIILKGSWCKGGQQREIPITHQLQRDILDSAHILAGSNSLIPHNRSYIQHLKVYESLTSRAGLHKLHGLRHKFAQNRFLDLTGVQSMAAANSAAASMASSVANYNNNNNNVASSSATIMTTSSSANTLSTKLSNSANPTNLLDLLSDQRYNPDIVDLTSTIHISTNSAPVSSIAIAAAPSKLPPVTGNLSPEQKAIHKQARLTISKELGHHRLPITSVYLGKPFN